uniref:Uncharacterized protein n=1 Tax=Brassica campestris TaxID=3711 RepID=A0A3P5ZUB2_BRACM|nr:unnamed protein product [Brassica rapa]
MFHPLIGSAFDLIKQRCQSLVDEWTTVESFTRLDLKRSLSF